MNAQRPLVIVLACSPSSSCEPNHVSRHIGDSTRSVQFPCDRSYMSSVKSQYGSETLASTACIACSNSSVNPMCCVMKPSPSCM